MNSEILGEFRYRNTHNLSAFTYRVLMDEAK